MEFTQILQEHFLALVGVLVLFLLLLYKRPKVFIAVFLIVVIISATSYIIIRLSSTGSTYKKELIEKTKEELF